MTHSTVVLGLWLVLCITFTTAVPLSSFYRYGSVAGDLLVPRGLDVTSGAILLPTPFLFFGTWYTNIFVNNHGDLTFHSSFLDHIPITFPIIGTPMIAPFWADVDTSGTGYVWYRTTNDTAPISKAMHDIPYNLSGSQFNPLWLFIATWDHVGYHSGHADKNNTFQCILATDNIQSFAIFQYADDLIQWTTGDSSNGKQGLGGTQAQIGLNAGDNANYVNVPGSRTSAIMNITKTSNVQVPGQWIFQLQNGTKPLQVDLCSGNQGHGPCQQICTNTAGSFNCSCYPGYNRSQYICNDINECLPNGGLGTCQQNCTNTNGSYYCSCKPGYVLSTDGSNCSDINECEASNGNCSERCTNFIGGYSCSCSLGYIWNPDNKTCSDMNECMINIGNCSQLCTNTIGSYMCSCNTGYTLSADERSCTDVDCQKAPKITVQPESVSTTLNSKVTLECRVSGCPNPQITWYKDNVATSNGPILVIQAATLSDRGFYSCKAVNDYGDVFSNEVKLSLKGVYQYSAYLELNITATMDIADELSIFLTGKSVANNTANIILANIRYSGTIINALITLAGNNTFPYNAIVDEIHYLLSIALEDRLIYTINVQRFDGCPQVSICDNRYVWQETEIGSLYILSPCIHRLCGGTYSTGGQWEAVILTCKTDYVSCAVSELENIVNEALNNTKVAKMLLSGIDSLINSNNDATYQSQDANRLLNLLNYYSNNAIINETTVFTGNVFATQLEDINLSKGCFTGRSFSINLGSVDMAAVGNTTIDRHSIGSNISVNTTASVNLLPLVSNNCSNSGSSVYRLTFYTFLKNTLFQSVQQEKQNMKLGSIIISVGGNAVLPLTEKLQFTFQVAKDTNRAYPAQWIKNYVNGSYQAGMWSTEGSRVLSRQNNVFRTETVIVQKGNTRQSTVYQGNFGMLLDLNPGVESCPAAEILTMIGTIVSIISLLFFVVTYLSSKILRRSEHGQVLINMSCALLCLYVAFLVAGYTTSVPAMCGFSAALVHYFMLVYFMWTLAEAVFLYIKLVKVLGNNVNRFSLKAGLVSWLVPLGIVIISAGAGYQYYYNQNYCRATGLPFYIGFILPFLAIYIFNWLVFVVTMVSIWKHSARSAVKQHNESGGKSFTVRHLIIAAGLALVLGLGWGFGLAASSHKISALACAFQFVFSLFVSSQGLLLLIFHGVRNKDAKIVWRSWVCFHSKSFSVGTSTSTGDSGTLQKSGLAASTHSTVHPPISLDEKSCSKSEDLTATEEKTVAEASSNGNNSSHVPDKVSPEMEKGPIQLNTVWRLVSFYNKFGRRGIPPHPKSGSQDT